MKTTIETPTDQEKKEAMIQFQAWYDSAKRRGFVGPFTKDFIYIGNHDGFSFWNNKSNGFGADDIRVIANFCEEYDYSFGFIGRKTDSPSMYGSVVCSINICKD